MSARGRFIVLALFGLTADQAIKFGVIKTLPAVSFLPTGVSFSLVNYRNANFAWSWPLSNDLIIVLMLILFLTGGIFYWQKLRHARAWLPLYLVAAGGLSNLVDRIWQGGVIDYLALPGGGVINLADVLILVGVILLIMRIKSN